jgi:hypothetical protein
VHKQDLIRNMCNGYPFHALRGYLAHYAILKRKKLIISSINRRNDNHNRIDSSYVVYTIPFDPTNRFS